MTAIVRLIVGSLVAAAAMFIVGALFWATPLARIAYTGAPSPAAASVQTTLAQSLTATGTGTYAIPDPMTSPGDTVLYGRGPIATVHFNSAGFSATDTTAFVAGYVHELIVALIIAFALYGIAGRVTDFASRARLVVLFGIAGAALCHLAEPVWFHYDWAWSIFGFVSNAAMLVAGGLVLTRWFLPKAV
jgi:hypothetical protein